MMLRFLHTHLLRVFLVLVGLSYGQVLAGNATCKHSCRFNSTIVCLQFYPSNTDLDDAKKMCMRYKSTLLSEREYRENSTCFKTYLHLLGDSSSAVWLLPENSSLNDIAHVLEPTGTFAENIEMGRHSMICISQGSPETSDTTSSVLNTRDHSPHNEKQALAGNATCEHSCRVNSKIVCLKFYPSKTELSDAKWACKKHNSTLLSEREYSGNPTCFKTYLHLLGDSSSAVWLLPENSALNDIAHVLEPTGTFAENIEWGRHSMICISQGTPGSGDPTASGKDRSNINTKADSDNKESNTPGTQTPTRSKDGHWEVAIHARQVTVAVVVSICCITCVVCGIILFQKREKTNNSIRKINTPVGRAATSLDSDEHTYEDVSRI